MSFLNYKLNELPDDIAMLLVNKTFLDIIVILLCSIIYIGGSAFTIYLMVKYPPGGRYELLLPYYMLFVVVNNFTISFPRRLIGIAYLYEGREQFIGFTTLLGPIGTFKLIALFIFFITRVGNVRLLRVPVYSWDYNSYWAQYFQLKAAQRREKNRRIILGKEIARRRRPFKRLWEILNKRIEIL